MKRTIISASLTALCLGCAYWQQPSADFDNYAYGASNNGMVLSIVQDGGISTNGMGKIKLIFKNVSDHKINFPKHFRGGVSYMEEMTPEKIETEEIDEDGNVTTIMEDSLIPRMIVSRGCGGRGVVTEDDVILLEPGETYTQTSHFCVAYHQLPVTLHISRAIYSSDLKVPNLWLGNIESNEIWIE